MATKTQLDAGLCFDVTCPVCGYDFCVVANGKSYRTEAAMTVRCTLPSCSSSFIVRVHLIPADGRAQAKLSAAIRRGEV